MNTCITRRAVRLGSILLLGLAPAVACALSIRGTASCGAGNDRDFFGLHDTEIGFGIMCMEERRPDLAAAADASVGVDAVHGAAVLAVQSWAIARIFPSVISSFASAGAFFDVQTLVREAPPFMPDFLPVDLQVMGSGRTSNGSNGSAHLTDLFGHVLFSYEWVNDRPSEDVVFTLSLGIEPGKGYGLGKGVTCTSRAVFVHGDDDVESTSCNVLFDPVAAFNQAAFDRTWGAASFPLDRYFALSLAPPGPAPVPAPATALLLLAGLGVLRRARGPHA